MIVRISFINVPTPTVVKFAKEEDRDGFFANLKASTLLGNFFSNGYIAINTKQIRLIEKM